MSGAARARGRRGRLFRGRLPAGLCANHQPARAYVKRNSNANSNAAAAPAAHGARGAAPKRRGLGGGKRARELYSLLDLEENSQVTENEVYTALWQVRARPISGDALPTPTCQPWHPRRHPLHLALASAFTVIAPLLLLPSAGPALTDCLDGHAYVQHNDDEDRAVQALFGTTSLADTRGKRMATEEVLPDGKPNAFKRLRDAQRAFGESPTANPEGPVTVVENVYPGTKKEQQGPDAARSGRKGGDTRRSPPWRAVDEEALVRNEPSRPHFDQEGHRRSVGAQSRLWCSEAQGNHRHSVQRFLVARRLQTAYVVAERWRCTSSER